VNVDIELVKDAGLVFAVAISGWTLVDKAGTSFPRVRISIAEESLGHFGPERVVTVTNRSPTRRLHVEELAYGYRQAHDEYKSDFWLEPGQTTLVSSYGLEPDQRVWIVAGGGRIYPLRTRWKMRLASWR
jgi:hypothetical protein